MKKIICLFSFLLVFNFQSKAQVYDSGDALLNVGIGLGSTFSNGKGIIPPLSVSYEKNFGILDELTLGGYVGFNSSKATYTFFGEEYGYNYSTFIIGARGSYHFWSDDKWDTYGGAMLGYRAVTVKEFGDFGSGSTTGSYGSGVSLSGFLGARYYFKDSMSAFAELGYGISYLTLGVSLKM